MFQFVLIPILSIKSMNQSMNQSLFLFGDEPQGRPVDAGGFLLEPRYFFPIPRLLFRFYREPGHLVAAHQVGIVLLLIGVAVDACKAILVIEVVVIVVRIKRRQIAPKRVGSRRACVRPGMRGHTRGQAAGVVPFSVLLLSLKGRTKGRGKRGIQTAGNPGHRSYRPADVLGSVGRSGTRRIQRTIAAGAP